MTLRVAVGQWLDVEPHEAPAVALGVTMFFLLFAGYFMLRPVRETMGVAGGVDRLQWLFTATFGATLVALPVFGWIASKVPRRRIQAWTYAFFGSHLLAFAAALAARPDDVWVARTFFVWLSVFNLLAISLAWSVLADVYPSARAKRQFALLAAGASLGGLAGPVLGTLLVGRIGIVGLLLLATAMLAASAVAGAALQRRRDRVAPDPRAAVDAVTPAAGRPLGGDPFDGARAVLRSPYLAGIALVVVLLATASTFLYFEQARLVAEAFPDRVRQTQVFGIVDIVVQTLSLAAQLFVTGRIARRLGVGALLVAVPLVVAVGFLWLALAPVFAVLAVVMVVRRAGEYALVRPGREMLYTVVPAAEKYKAKNFVDTVVYRGADAVAGWVKAGVDAVSSHPAAAMLLGGAIALVWAGNGALVARAFGRREQAAAADRGAVPPRGAAAPPA